MATPQIGIFALGTVSQAYLEFDLGAGAAPARAVASVASLREPQTTIGGVNLVAGFRPELWAQVAPTAAPRDVSGFNRPIAGPTGYVMPATQHDIMIWLSGGSYDTIFDVSRATVRALGDVATFANEIVGFSYHHDRDLTGFIDGTENPTIVEAAEVALIPTGEPGEGGSVHLLQQWEHNQDAWESLPVGDQERIMGRRKPDSTELDPAPPDSHVRRTDQDEFGKIFRRNIAYGSLRTHGTVFSGFCRDQRILHAMLESMVGARARTFDRLTTVTTALTGAYYFIPSGDALAALAADARV